MTINPDTFSRTFRLLPRSNTAGQITLPSGRKIDGSSAYVDLLENDHFTAINSGWTKLCEVGTTEARAFIGPFEGERGNFRQRNYQFFDTDLAVLLFWHPELRAWLDVTGVAQ